MKLDDRYEIRVVIIEIREGNGSLRCLGDVYTSMQEFKSEKPENDYRFGFIVFDTQTGFMPDECNEWNDSVEEAIQDYEDHVR